MPYAGAGARRTATRAAHRSLTAAVRIHGNRELESAVLAARRKGHRPGFRSLGQAKWRAPSGSSMVPGEPNGEHAMPATKKAPGTHNADGVRVGAEPVPTIRVATYSGTAS